MQTTNDVFATLDQETVINNAPRVHDTWGVGDVAHQGDLIFVGISGLPASARPRQNRQLADGATQGSRHICERGDVYAADAEEVVALIREATGSRVCLAYIGPVLRGPCFVPHPEHGSHEWPGECTVAVVYQRSLDSEEREARVQD